jgi:DNA-directed RNA polymerase subunit RPC12/RpoP
VKPAYCANCGHNVILKERNYTPDVVLGNGVVVEIKGKFTGEMRTKMLAVRRCNPDLDIRMLFQADNWLTRKKKQRYSDWCERNGFTYHVGEQVPSDWVE